MFRHLVCALLCVPVLFAGAISFNPGDVTGWFSDGIPRTIGYQFIATNTVNVTRLGYVDAGQDGLVEAHSVAIWELNGTTPLATGSIASGTSAPLDGMFRWVGISGLQLIAGRTYIIIGSYAGSEPWTWDPPCCAGSTGVLNLVVDPRIQLGGPGYARASVFTTDVNVYPSWLGLQNGDTTRTAFIGPNLDFEAAAIPEPGTVGLVLAGLAGVGVAAVRRRSN